MADDIIKIIQEDAIDVNIIFENEEIPFITDESTIIDIVIGEGTTGKSAYQSYLDTTTDNPPLTEQQWSASFTPDPNTVIDANYVHTDNNYTTTEKNKLAGIAAGAEVNVNADWNATSGDAQILNKPTIPSIAGLATEQYVQDYAVPKVGAETIQFDTTLDETTPLLEGEWRYNKHDKTFEWGTGFSKTQANQEIGLPVINHTGVKLLNGKLIRITGYNGSYYEIDYSDNSTEETAHVDGMLTSDVEDGEVTIFTKIGLVRGRNTSGLTENDDVWLGTNGDWTTTEPISPKYKRLIGHVGKISATEGEIYIDITGLGLGDIDEKLTAMGMPHGIPLDQKSNIIGTYNQSTRTLNISGTFYYFHKTVKYIKTDLDLDLIHPNTSGVYFVYADEDSIEYSDIPWELGEVVPMFLILYNNSVASTYWLGPQGKLMCERHGTVMDKATHKEFHENMGCYASGGFGLAGYTTGSGSGGLTANTFSIDSGDINDEDNKTTPLALPDNNGVGNVYDIWYKDGSSWKWFKTNLPYLISNQNIVYNLITAGSGSLVELTDNGAYMNMYLVATPELDATTGLVTYSYGLIIGQSVSSLLLTATSRTFFDLDLTGFPAQEVAALYQITFERKNAHDINGHCRIESVKRIVGTRYVNGTAATSPSVHNNLSGRSDANSHPISAITDLTETLAAKEDIWTYSLITLDVAGWTANEQTETITGMTSTSFAELFAPDGDDTALLVGNAAQVRISGKGTDSITIKCTTTPTATITDAIIRWRN